MTQVVSSISGLQVYAPSAGYAPTNSADVSAIASGYQVVSSTSTELYAGTAFLTGVNGAPVSASRAGNAANAGMANSAYYDGTGRLISSLPDSAAVSSIASAYAESAASGKQDTLTFGYDDDKISAINGSALAGGITGDYLTSKVGSGQATFSTAFQDGLEKRPSLIIGAERSAGTTSYPRMMITDWNDTAGDTHSGVLLANAFEFYRCPTSAKGEVDPSGFVAARLDADKYEMGVNDGVSSKTRSAYYGRSGMHIGYSGDTASWVKVTGDIYYGGLISLDNRNGIHGVIYPSSMGYWNGKLDGSASSSFYTTANESGYVDSAYVDSAVSGKQDSLTFAYDADSAISSINGSAVAVGSVLVTGTAWDTTSSAAVYASTKLSAMKRMVLEEPNTQSRQNIVYGLADDRGINYALEANWLAPGAVQVSSNSTFRYMPKNSMWTTADAATGVFTPLRYATGACLAMDAATNFKAYYKGNEWFVSDSRYGMVRGEIHQSRGLRIVASGANSASGFQLHPSGVDGVDTNGSAWRYGANEYTSLTSVASAVSSNSADWNSAYSLISGVTALLDAI